MNGSVGSNDHTKIVTSIIFTDKTEWWDKAKKSIQMKWRDRFYSPGTQIWSTLDPELKFAKTSKLETLIWRKGTTPVHHSSRAKDALTSVHACASLAMASLAHLLAAVDNR